MVARVRPPNMSGSRIIPRNRHSAAKLIARISTLRCQPSDTQPRNTWRENKKPKPIGVHSSGVKRFSVSDDSDSVQQSESQLAGISLSKCRDFSAFALYCRAYASFIPLFACCCFRVCNLLLPPLYAAFASHCVCQLCLTVDSFIVRKRSYNFSHQHISFVCLFVVV